MVEIVWKNKIWFEISLAYLTTYGQQKFPVDSKHGISHDDPSDFGLR